MILLVALSIVVFAHLKRSTGFVQQQRHQRSFPCTDLYHQRRVALISRIVLPSSKPTDDCCPPPSAGINPPARTIIKPDILQPFLPAADPNYRNVAPVGQGHFVVCRYGGPVREELTNENILRIVQIQCSDLEVNTLVWKCLGYRFCVNTQRWTADECFPNWKEKFPEPPDFIGMQRIYSPQVDKPSLKANQALVRSIPLDNKQSLKTHLKPLGWKGYQYSELTPNKTRRAQCANWLIYYREELFGYSVEELRERRKRRKEEAEAQKEQDLEWKPPVKEVF